jgi:methionyl-tRNA formyltransferase
MNAYIVATVKPWNVAAFLRRNAGAERIDEIGAIASLYDFIRMLDAETYPRAFIDWNEFRAEFSDAEIDGNTVRARVVLRKA